MSLHLSEDAVPGIEEVGPFANGENDSVGVTPCLTEIEGTHLAFPHESCRGGEHRTAPVIILTGGLSQRMGTDKAFLEYSGRSFISLIASEMLRVSDEVVVVVGTKSRTKFESVLDDGRLKITNDEYHFANPLGGMLTGFNHINEDYAAVIPCDTPLIKGDVIEFLFKKAQYHSAAVPVWDHHDRMTMEPLCAVYNVREAKQAILDAMREPKTGPKRMVLHLSDVRYVHVSQLRALDRDLDSLVNINAPEDYLALISGRNEAHVPKLAIRIHRKYL